MSVVIINKLSFEVHFQGYNYCGSETKLAKRVVCGDKGINDLDQACRFRDISFSENKGQNQRHIAHKILAEFRKEVKLKTQILENGYNSYLVTNAMKAELKLGVGLKKKIEMKIQRKNPLKILARKEGKLAVKNIKLKYEEKI